MTVPAECGWTDIELAGLCDHAKVIGGAVANAARLYHLADELTSAALTGLAEACHSWRPDSGSSFDDWANSRMHNRAIDALRLWLGRHGKAKPQAAMFDGDDARWLALVVDGADEPSIEDDACRSIFALIAVLPARTQDALLSDLRDDRLAAIGAHYGVTESRMVQIRKAAREQLRAAM